MSASPAHLLTRQSGSPYLVDPASEAAMTEPSVREGRAGARLLGWSVMLLVAAAMVGGAALFAVEYDGPCVTASYVMNPALTAHPTPDSAVEDWVSWNSEHRLVPSGGWQVETRRGRHNVRHSTQVDR